MSSNAYAGLAIAALLSISSTLRAQQEPPEWAEARLSVERAEGLFGAGNFAGALADYTKAYQLLAGHPRRYVVLHNLAVCHERMFHYDEAVRHYERYLEEGGPGAEDATAITTALQALRNMLATLHVESNVHGELWVDQRRVGDAPATLMIPAGSHQVELRAPRYESERREATFFAGSSHTIRFDLTPLSNFRGIGPGYFYAGVALTGALFVTWGVLAAATAAAHDSAVESAARSMQLRTESLEREQAHVSNWALATDVTLGAAAFCGAATLVAFALTDWGPEERRPSVQWSPTAGGLAVRGQLP